MDLYKGEQEESRFVYICEDADAEKQSYSFNPVHQVIPSDCNQKTIKADLISLFEIFQESLMKKSNEGVEFSLTEMNVYLKSIQLEDKTYDFIIQSNFIDQIINLLLNPLTNEIYNQLIFLIINLFSLSKKYKKNEIFEKFNSIKNFNLLDYFLNKINPDYQKVTEQSIEQILLQMDTLFPHFLHLISFYCFIENVEIRDLILQAVIQPCIEIFFSNFEDHEMTSNASLLIYSSTKLPFKESQNKYVAFIIDFFVKNVKNLDSLSQRYFFKSINNLISQNENVIKILFESNFDGLIEFYINQKKEFIDDKSLKYALILKLKMLCEDNESVTVVYPKLIDIGISKFNRSKKVAFELFQKALELKNDQPFNDDQFFNYFIESLRNGKFEMKYEFIKILAIWSKKSNQLDILSKSDVVIDEVSQFLQQFSVSDDLFVVLLDIIKVLFEKAQSSSEHFEKLKSIVNENNGFAFLADIQSDSESPEIVINLIQYILNL